MGTDFHPVGFDACRAEIDLFATEAHRMGFTQRRVTPEEYFQEYLSA